MKKIFVFLVFVFSTFLAFGESESVGPTRGVTLEREVFLARINGENYSKVTVELKAADGVWVEGVKVVVRDTETGKRLYKKRFSKSYLYAFSNGTIEVGKGNALTQISLEKLNGRWIMILKEKGIY